MSTLKPRAAARGLLTARTSGGHPKTTLKRYSFTGPLELGCHLDDVVRSGKARSRSDALRRLVVALAKAVSDGTCPPSVLEPGGVRPSSPPTPSRPKSPRKR